MPRKRKHKFDIDLDVGQYSPKSQASEDWLKVVHLKKKGYSHEEAVAIVEKIAAEKSEFDSVLDVPPKRKR